MDFFDFLFFMYEKAVKERKKGLFFLYLFFTSFLFLGLLCLTIFCFIYKKYFYGVFLGIITFGYFLLLLVPIFERNRKK